MTTYLVIWIALTFAFARILVLTVPAFAPALEAHFLTNAAVGTASDLAIVFIVAFTLFSLDKVLTISKSWKKILRCAVAGVSLAIIVGLYAHVAFVEYFNMTIRPSYVFNLLLEDLLLAISKIISSSWRIQVLFAAPVLLTILIGQKWPRATNSLGKFPLIYLIAAIFFNSLNINMRHGEGVHPELRYNAFTAFYYNIKAYRDAAPDIFDVKSE